MQHKLNQLRASCIKFAKLFFFTLAATSMYVGDAPAYAEVSEKDLKIISRTVSFLESVTSPTVLMAVIEESANPNSVKDADKIIAFFTANAKAGKKNLVAQKVSASDLYPLKEVDVVFIPSGLEAFHEAIGQQAVTLKILAVSTDDNCVKNNHCATSVKSTPRVEILVNQALAEQSGIKFNSAFLMLVKKQ